MLGDPGLDSRQRKYIFLFYKTSRPALGLTHISFSEYRRVALSPGMKRPEREANYSLSSSPRLSHYSPQTTLSQLLKFLLLSRYGLKQPRKRRLQGFFPELIVCVG
jgi:hypothetical protein